jgi:hypothetical protein
VDNPVEKEFTEAPIRRLSSDWLPEISRLTGIDGELRHLQRDAKRQWIIAGA